MYTYTHLHMYWCVCVCVLVHSIAVTHRHVCCLFAGERKRHIIEVNRKVKAPENIHLKSLILNIYFFFF